MGSDSDRPDENFKPEGRGAADSSSKQQDSADQLTSVQHPITPPANVDVGRLFDSSAKGGTGAWTTDLRSLPAKREDEFTRNAFPALSMKDVCSISNGFPVHSFEIFTGFTKTSCSDEIYFISYVCCSCFIVEEDDNERRGSVRG